jgi:hypothetical protein
MDARRKTVGRKQKTGYISRQAAPRVSLLPPAIPALGLHARRELSGNGQGYQVF